MRNKSKSRKSRMRFYCMVEKKNWSHFSIIVVLFLYSLQSANPGQGWLHLWLPVILCRWTYCTLWHSWNTYNLSQLGLSASDTHLNAELSGALFVSDPQTPCQLLTDSSLICPVSLGHFQFHSSSLLLK